ncbi:hypothetical protein N7447_005982 [Penicillium robsamsonii]|uniref:uncharacterized protein n=1 Tax=Penicillium robsamsonii TaxID=1792511 RepID=UPI00254925F9|nr:uncharacterized protein N7447_005982 [Penicillium robsamsonii]KAJ5823642.1 hypothetical protein N7447_005982 [Penicillium robsamsonii]
MSLTRSWNINQGVQAELRNTKLSTSTTNRLRDQRPLMAPKHGLVRLWKTKGQQIFTGHLSNKDHAACRLVCRKFATYLTPILFADIEVRFRSNRETFLPPILDPIMGIEQIFIYKPQRRQLDSSSPRYSSGQMTELLVNQYPPPKHIPTSHHLSKH